MSYSLFRIGLAMGFAGLVATSVESEPLPLPKPEGPVLLTLTGDLAQTNDGEAARFDLRMLEELGTVSLVTSTPWTVGTLHFEGVTLKAVLDRVGATGDLIFAEAFNDYSSEIPISDATDKGAVIAFRMEGKEMTLRDKGPLWVVFPYDDDAVYRSEIYLTRSIWQLDRITVKDSQPRSQP